MIPQPSDIPIGDGGVPEKPNLKIGIIPLTDCAAIVAAQQMGFFARHQLDVEICRENAWATIRDKVAVGLLDGAHMLAGMPIASTLGIGGVRCQMVTSLSLSLNGNAITISNHLAEEMEAAHEGFTTSRALSAEALRNVVMARRASGGPPVTFGMVFPVSTHNYELRYWMASVGLHPDRDVRLIVVPPPLMVESMAQGRIDGFCVGEPWNELAVTLGIGRIVMTKYELWQNSPEKVLGVTRQWAERYPNTHRALVRALIEAARWVDVPDHRSRVSHMIAATPFVNAPPRVIRMSMTGELQYSFEDEAQQVPDFVVFHRYAATFPWRSHAIWLLTQMYRWGQIDDPCDLQATAAEVYQSALYRAAAADVGVASPTIDCKSEGTHESPWTLTDATEPIAMGPDHFFDGASFNPARPIDYIQQTGMRTISDSALDALAAMQPSVPV